MEEIQDKYTETLSKLNLFTQDVTSYVYHARYPEETGGLPLPEYTLEQLGDMATKILETLRGIELPEK